MTVWKYFFYDKPQGVLKNINGNEIFTKQESGMTYYFTNMEDGLMQDTLKLLTKFNLVDLSITSPICWGKQFNDEYTK